MLSKHNRQDLVILVNLRNGIVTTGQDELDGSKYALQLHSFTRQRTIYTENHT